MDGPEIFRGGDLKSRSRAELSQLAAQSRQDRWESARSSSKIRQRLAASISPSNSPTHSDRYFGFETLSSFATLLFPSPGTDYIAQPTSLNNFAQLPEQLRALLNLISPAIIRFESVKSSTLTSELSAAIDEFSDPILVLLAPFSIFASSHKCISIYGQNRNPTPTIDCGPTFIGDLKTLGRFCKASLDVLARFCSLALKSSPINESTVCSEPWTFSRLISLVSLNLTCIDGILLSSYSDSIPNDCLSELFDANLHIVSGLSNILLLLLSSPVLKSVITSLVSSPSQLPSLVLTPSLSYSDLMCAMLRLGEISLFMLSRWETKLLSPNESLVLEKIISTAELLLLNITQILDIQSSGIFFSFKLSTFSRYCQVLILAFEHLIFSCPHYFVTSFELDIANSLLSAESLSFSKILGALINIHSYLLISNNDALAQHAIWTLSSLHDIFEYDPHTRFLSLPSLILASDFFSALYFRLFMLQFDPAFSQLWNRNLSDSDADPLAPFLLPLLQFFHYAVANQQHLTDFFAKFFLFPSLFEFPAGIQRADPIFLLFSTIERSLRSPNRQLQSQTLSLMSDIAAFQTFDERLNTPKIPNLAFSYLSRFSTNPTPVSFDAINSVISALYDGLLFSRSEDSFARPSFFLSFTLDAIRYATLDVRKAACRCFFGFILMNNRGFMPTLVPPFNIPVTSNTIVFSKDINLKLQQIFEPIFQLMKVPRDLSAYGLTLDFAELLLDCFAEWKIIFDHCNVFEGLNEIAAQESLSDLCARAQNMLDYLESDSLVPPEIDVNISPSSRYSF